MFNGLHERSSTVADRVRSIMMNYWSVQEMFGCVAAEFGPRVAIERVNTNVTYSEF